MATKKKPLPDAGPPTGAPTGVPTGAPTGAPTGVQPVPLAGDELDLDECEGAIARERASLADEVLIYESDNEGRSVGGARLGPLPIDPLSTLADRIVEQWGGPRTYWVRIRRPDGTVARWARVRQRGYRPGIARTAAAAPAPAAPAAAAVAPVFAAPAAPDAFGMLRELRDLGLFAPAAAAPAAAPAAPPPPPPTIAQQVRDMQAAVTALEGAGMARRASAGETNTVVEVVKELKPVVMDLLGQVMTGLELLSSSRKEAAKAQAEEAKARAEEAKARQRTQPTTTTGGTDG